MARQSLSRRGGRRRAVLIVAAALVTGLAGCVVAVVIVNQPTLTAAGALSRYVVAIEDGDLGEANQLVPTPPGSPRPLGGTVLSQRAERISGVTTTIIASSDASATGRVSFELAGHRETATLKLGKAAARLGVLPNWHVITPLTTTISFHVPAQGTAIANSTETPLGPDRKLTVYPGLYSVGLAPDSRWFTSPTQSVAAGTEPISVTPVVTPTQALKNEILSQVKKTIDSCVAMAVPNPSGCPFSVQTFGTVSGFGWHLNNYPTVSVLDASHFFVQGGQVTAKYVYSYRYNTNKQESDPVSISGPGSLSFHGTSVVASVDPR